MRRALFVLTTLLVACSSKDEPAAAPVADAFVEVESDVAVDTGTVDASPPNDAAPCSVALDGALTCRAPRERPGKTVCTDAAIRAMLVCFGTDTKACSDATAEYPSCSACVKDWLEGERIDFAACVRAVDPSSACGTTVQCTLDCLDAVCGACDSRVGTGSLPARSARDDCEIDAAKNGSGACWELAAKDYTACATDPKFGVCFPRGAEEMLAFFRGACRDGGDYSRVYEEQKADAATD